MIDDSYSILAGVDWGSRRHQVCVLGSSGNLLGEGSFEHTAESLAKLVEWLLDLAEGQAGAIAVGIEKPHGAVVDALLERLIAVYPINPKQVDRFRDRHAVSGAKDDPRDALVIADALRTDLHRFRRLEPLGMETIVLRELLCVYGELRKEEIALCNRIRELLLRCLPQLLSLAPHRLIDPFFWTVLERFTSPEQTTPLDHKSIKELLRQYRIRRFSAKRVMEILRQPALPVAAGTMEAVTHHVRLLVKRLRLANEQRKVAEKQLDEKLGEFGFIDDKSQHYTDVTILLSFPGVGRVVLATLLSYAGQVIRSRNLVALRALAGVAPVTKRSGTRCQVTMRRACILPLRNALYHWALAAIKKDEGFKNHYSKLRARGHRHGRALRGVIDRILNITMAALHNGTLYDPSRPHSQNQKSRDE